MTYFVPPLPPPKKKQQLFSCRKPAAGAEPTPDTSIEMVNATSSFESTLFKQDDPTKQFVLKYSQYQNPK